MPSTPSQEELAAFDETFDQLLAAMQDSRRRAAASANAGLTASQVDLLAGLETQPRGLRVSQIATAAGVAGPTATRMLNILSERGLVEHGRDERDARAVIVRLTRAGRAALKAHLAELRARQQEAFEQLDPEIRARLIADVQQLTALIRASGFRSGG